MQTASGPMSASLRRRLVPCIAIIQSQPGAAWQLRECCRPAVLHAMQQALMASHEHALLCRDMSGNCCRTFTPKRMQVSLSHSSWWSSTSRAQALPSMYLTSFLATGSGFSLSSQITIATTAAVQRIFWSLHSSKSHPWVRSARRARVRRP